MNITMQPEPPRRSHIVRAEINAYRSALSDAAKRSDREDYDDALASLKAVEAELRESEGFELQQAQDHAARQEFRAKYGADSIGALLADRIHSGKQAAEAEAFQADRKAQIAAALYAPKPTAEELGAQVHQNLQDTAAEMRRRADNHGKAA